MNTLEGIAHRMAKTCIEGKVYPAGMSESDALEVLACGFEYVLHTAFIIRDLQFTGPLPGEVSLRYGTANLV